MLQQEIHDFLIRYFTTNHCTVIENQSGYLTVQLTVEMDKELMNRPFYWHYLEKVGGVPNPMSITLITNQEKTPSHVKGENIHFGSPRLHQIFSSAKSLSKYIRLFEELEANEKQQIPLFPWLCVNVNISYECDRKKDRFCSIGLNLINGMIIEDFMERVDTRALTSKISDYTFTLTPIIRHSSGLNRIKTMIQSRIYSEDHTWAQEAKDRWAKDQQLLDHFYEDAEEEVLDAYEKEKEALRLQYNPEIHVKIINGGLFYLSNQAV